MWNLGLGEFYFVFVMYGCGLGDFFDVFIVVLLKEQVSYELLDGLCWVVIVGKLNVGKLFFLNCIVCQNCVVVLDIFGMMVDFVDELVIVGGIVYQFIDIVGLCKRVKEVFGYEYYVLLCIQVVIECVEVCVVVIDVLELISDQDFCIFMMVENVGWVMVIVYNKWDLIDEE